MNRPPLGQLLVQCGVLSESTLAEVLELQKTERRRLGDLLAERGLVPPRRLAQILSYQLSCPWVSLNNVEIPRALIELVPSEIAIAHTLVPVHLREADGRRCLYVATHDPTDEAALANCAHAVRMQVKPMIAITYEIRQALARYYGTPPPSLRPAPAPLHAVRTPKAPDGGGAELVPRIPKPPAVPRRVVLKSVPPPPPEPTPPAALSHDTPTVPPRAASTPPSDDAATEHDARAVPRETPTVPPRAVPTSPPRATSARPPHDTPTLPPRSIPTQPPRMAPIPPVLVLNAPERFREQCAVAAIALGADVIDGTLMNATEVAMRSRPAAIVVTDDIYAFDRAGLNRLAIETDALLVVWSDDVDAQQLEPLLHGAFQRARRVPSRAAS